MTETFGIQAAVRFLRPPIEKAGFRSNPPRARKGLLRRPEPYSSYRDVARWSKDDRHIAIAVDREELQVVVWRDGEDGIRLDIGCPVEMARIGGVEVLRRFTRETLQCVCDKLLDWLKE